MLVTPLQLATAVATLANRGRFVQPRMLKETDSGTPAIYATMPDVEVRNPEHWDTVLEAMQMVVSSQMTDKKDHNQALREILEQLPNREVDRETGVRLMMVSSENDDLEFVDMVESVGWVQHIFCG